MSQLVVIGCGNIGFRHLQAMTEVESDIEITVSEPNPAHHQRIIDHLEQTHKPFELVTSVPTDRRHIRVAVIATGAAERRAAVEELMSNHEVDTLVLEKVLFQTIGDVADVERQLSDREVSTFVNCGRRTFPGYLELRDRLQQPIDVTVSGQRLGLASNIVHFLDLVEFLNHDTLTSIDASGLAPGSVPSKREGCIDLFGRIRAATENGAHLDVVSDDLDPTRVVVELADAVGEQVVIDELERSVRRGRGSLLPFASQNVSETVDIYADLIATGTCALTPYADSARQHRLLIPALRDHLGLSNEKDVPCPIS